MLLSTLYVAIYHADRINMDRLSPLFKRFSPTARVFHMGNTCQAVTFAESEGVGHLHLLRSGKLTINTKGEIDRVLSEPTVIFSPKPQFHRLTPLHASGVEMACASIELGKDKQNPFVAALPPLMVIAKSDAPDLFTKIEWLFEEADQNHCGSDAAVEILMEYVLILLMRFVMDMTHGTQCILNGLGDERLARAITAIHEQPENPWTLDSLAEQANMSRSRFAHYFKEAIGITPLDYLTDWRLGVARNSLRQGKSVSRVARDVGYKDSSAFTRAFKRRVGETPREWLASIKP